MIRTNREYDITPALSGELPFRSISERTNPPTHQIPTYNPIREVRLILIASATLLVGSLGVGFTANRTEATAWWNEINLTSAQKEYRERFNSASIEERVRNAVVGPEGTNLRKRPSSLSYSDNHIVRKLQPGEVITEAIWVPGNDPAMPHDSKRTGWWLFIPGDNTFTYGGNVKSLSQPR